MKKVFFISLIALAVLVLNYNSYSTDNKKPTKPQTTDKKTEQQAKTPAEKPAVAEGAKLEIVGGDTYNWNDVKPKDSPLKGTVKLKNIGTETLIISEVKPGCGCTTKKLEKDTIPPGDEAALDITLNIGSTPGPVTKSVRISSNDPKSPKQLYLKCNVVTPLNIIPANISLRDMVVGVESTTMVTIKNTSNTEVDLYDFKVSEGAAINTQGTVKLKPNESVDIQIKVKPEKAGYMGITLDCKTSNPEQMSIHVRGGGQVKESPILNSK